MNILHVVPTYWPAVRYGGPIQSVHGLCAALVRRGHSVEVFTTNVDGPGVSDVPVGRPLMKDGVSITYFATGLGRRLYRAPSLGRALTRSVARFQVVHSHSVFLWPPLAAARTAHKAGVAHVVSPRGMLVPELIARKSSWAKRGWIELLERRTLQQAAAVHATSDLEATDIARMGFRTQRLVTIPNGVEVPEFQPGPTRIDHIGGPRVLFLGRINWKKGLEQLIPAMAHCPQAQLVIAGNDEEGLQPRLRQCAHASGVAERTHFIGPVHGEEKWRILASADIFVLPSSSENFGIALIEAMGVGVPVVTTPGVGLAGAIARAGSGLVVEAPGAGPLGAAIAALLGNLDARLKMGRAGRALVREHFAWSAIAGQFEDLYSMIAQRAPSQPAVHA